MFGPLLADDSAAVDYWVNGINAALVDLQGREGGSSGGNVDCAGV